MKFILGYRTELFIIFLVPIHPLRWYRFIRYSGTGSSAMMVPIRALRWYRLTDTIKSERASSKFVIATWGDKNEQDCRLMQRNLLDIMNQTDEILHLIINGNLDSNGSLHVEIRCKETGKAVDLSMKNANLINDEN